MGDGAWGVLRPKGLAGRPVSVPGAHAPGFASIALRACWAVIGAQTLTPRASWAFGSVVGARSAADVEARGREPRVVEGGPRSPAL